jgi:thiamine biosynthesis lipoprotein
MIQLYQKFYLVTEKKFTPCIGTLLEDIGYDPDYSLVAKSISRPVPDFLESVLVIDDETIELTAHVLLDLGALGKGYCVDLVAKYLADSGVKHFLVDGSGDIFYRGAGVPITVGLEHPHDETKVIGTLEMLEGAMCSSATGRRSWGKYSHYIDPLTKESPQEIVATWVLAKNTALADAMASVLFFAAPEDISSEEYSYCIMNCDYKVKRSQDFQATFY